MSEAAADQRARDRFRDERTINFAVSANAGSGKTTAISERLAALALAPDGAELLRKTAVVTFTKKAAAQIGQRAREVLVRRMADRPRAGLAPLEHLERAFFGTIHSFCLLLAQRYGQTIGINLNPAVVAEDDEALWEEFLEQDAMQFTGLAPAQIDAFLRHAPLDSIFHLARSVDAETAARLRAKRPSPLAPEPAPEAHRAIREATTRKGAATAALQRNQAAIEAWLADFRDERGYLPILQPEGAAGGIEELFAGFFAPLKRWLAEAGAVLAAELALRYRAWRFDRGVQTYADQIETALAVVKNPEILDRIRDEGWRVVLDEAQDTDPSQFAVLIEITRPPGAKHGTWPRGGGAGPRPGFFCMVGDGQQAIYSSRADLRNFRRHLAAFEGDAHGAQLTFDVTFRTPHRLVSLLNATLPAAFGAGRPYNSGLPPADGAPAPLLQVPYEPFVGGPANAEGAVGVVPLASIGTGKLKVDLRLAAEVRQLAAFLSQGGPAAVGARTWGDVCLIAPRNSWLAIARKELEAAGLKTALQMRKNRNGDIPVYAWICGLLTALCDPDNAFEWVGVLREIFAVSDADLAEALRAEKIFHWDQPERYRGALAEALTILKPLVERVDAEEQPLERFAAELVRACGLESKAWSVDPTGALAGELERLLAQAAEMGLTGAGPRAWQRELVSALDGGRPAGKPADDAINLLTSHSAKGLEWPVVIPLGLWRKVGKHEESGLRLIPDEAGQEQVYFDAESLPAATKDARERERLRELVRLLYVTLTRARRLLVLPWGAEFAAADDGSFAELWGADLNELPVLSGEALPVTDAAGDSAVQIPVVGAGQPGLAIEARPAAPLPLRLLPHQLAHQPDVFRAVRHDSTLDDPLPTRGGEDPLDYGLWWHETLEYVPWGADEAALASHGARTLAVADAKGFRARAEEEWTRLLGSAVWRELGEARWTRLAELAVLAPLRADAWIDGVVDLVVHDPAAAQLWIVDWKTNRRRPGESDDVLLTRLAEEYEPQLAAYGSCLAGFFPGCALRLLVYSTVAGSWREVPS